MHPRVNGNLDLGADPVIGGDENRIGKTRRLEVKNSAEAADFGIRAGPPCGARERLDLFDQGIAGVDIDTGTGIGETLIFHTDPVPSPQRAGSCLQRKESKAAELTKFRFQTRIAGICSNPWRLPTSECNSAALASLLNISPPTRGGRSP